MIHITTLRLIEVELPIRLSNSNDGRGHSFWRTKRKRDEFEATLRLYGDIRTPLDDPVFVRVTRLYSGRERAWDYSSGLRGDWKELEDSLVACGWFHDDSPKWIRGVVFDQHKRDQSGTRIEIFSDR